MSSSSRHLTTPPMLPSGLQTRRQGGRQARLRSSSEPKTPLWRRGVGGAVWLQAGTYSRERSIFLPTLVAGGWQLASCREPRGLPLSLPESGKGTGQEGPREPPTPPCQYLPSLALPWHCTRALARHCHWDKAGIWPWAFCDVHECRITVLYPWN